MCVCLFWFVQAFADTNPSLEGEKKRFLAKVLQGYERKGMHLDDAKRDRILKINERQTKLGIEFSKALGAENTKLHFSADELDGVRCCTCRHYRGSMVWSLRRGVQLLFLCC